MLFTGCSDSIQEANRLVSRGNQKFARAKELADKAIKMNSTLFSGNLSLAESKALKSGEAREIVKKFEQSAELASVAAKDLYVAANMDIPTTYQTYYAAKAHYFDKSVELMHALKANAQSYLALNDEQILVEKLTENNTRLAQIDKEVAQLADKVSKIEISNPSFLKPTPSDP